ncbi:uncharacterized protein LOC124274322 [Haliotis rubra]|uniref:uncharacterized protein LOC124274322 n=1 Tax=Haliotis rubra TaxID=36100 RepID=UPI001EE58E11|nr:uncharacterized protein LOC124274322 [Haliotis rubra]XP_046565632.1 uncharacterized protein LOC124274322 [Haliotis rubra]
MTMSNNRCLPPGDQSAGSVFNICRGRDRYSQFEDDDILDHTPPPLDFPTPIKFEPRKSKFHFLLEKEDRKDVGHGMQSGEWAAPKVILKKPCKIGGEKLKQQLLMSADSRRASIDGSSPHGSIEVHPASVEAVQLFQKAQQAEVYKPMTVPRMFRSQSDTSLFQSVAGALKLRGDNSIVKPNNNTSVISTSAENKCYQVDKNPGTFQNEDMHDEVNKSSVSVSSKFSGWLFGGNKKIDVKDTDINVFSPTSY